jgi:CHAT domain-containing protein/uncharacterized protein HemY
MNNECLWEDRTQRSICLLILTFALFLNVSMAKDSEAATVQASSAGGQQLLEQGKPVQRQISEGQIHSFRVDLKAGQFIHLFIRQLGINVAATLIAPDREKALEADIPRSMQEAEWLSYVATTSGEYRIEIRTVEKGVPTGRYEVEILEQRKSAAEDEARITAQKIFAEGNRLYQQKNYRGAIEKYQEALRLYRASARRTEAAVTLNCIALSTYYIVEYQAAIDRYKEALAIYREINDVQGQGYTLNEIGDAYFGINRYNDAITFYEQALQARQKAGYRAGEGGTLYNLGVVYRALSQYEKALQYYEQALTIFREVKARREEGRALKDLGHTNKSLGHYEKAIEYYKQALPITQEVHDRTTEAETLVGIGNTYNALSRYEDAIENYQRALTIARELKNRSVQGNSLVGLSNVYDSLTRYEESIEYLEQALVIAREGKSRVAEGRVLNNLGSTYTDLGQYEKAIDYYKQALAIKREVHDRTAEGNTLGNLGTLYWIVREYQKAIDCYEQQLTISREVRDPSGEASALWGLGDVYNSLGQYDKAIDHDKQALAISQRVGNRKDHAGMLIGLGEAYRNIAQYEKSLECYGQALTISREIKDRANEATSFNSLMLVWEQQKNSPVAILYGKQAVNVFQEIRGSIRTLESRQSYLKSHEDSYRHLADLLISAGRLAEAEKVLELLKEEEFNRVIRRNGPNDTKVGLTNSETGAAKITDQLAQLASERGLLLAKVANNTATDQDRQQLDLIETKITEANKKIKVVLAEVAKASADEKLVTQQSQSMMQSLRKLGPGVVALYTVLTNEKGWVILTTPDFRRAYPINTIDLNKTISDFRLTLKSSRYDPVPLAQKLYTALFLQKNDEGATLAADLKAYKARTLMWSLDGVLRYIPIDALHDGKQYLVEKYPSLVFTTESLTRLLDPSDGNWRALGLGVSKQYKDFPALTAVPRELHSIIRETGDTHSTGVLPGVIRLDDQFTREALVDGLRQGYPVVHIASHFKFSPERYETSFLLLGDGSDLTLDDLQNSPGIFESVELLTLSACDTATVGANGKEMEGLAFVAQNLGAKAVIASLWPVADEGTEVLMREFYRLREANPQWSKVEALRQAQIALLRGKDSGSKQAAERGVNLAAIGIDKGMTAYKRDSKVPFAHPHYWAPFILIGNWK